MSTVRHRRRHSSSQEPQRYGDMVKVIFNEIYAQSAEAISWRPEHQNSTQLFSSPGLKVISSPYFPKPEHTCRINELHTVEYIGNLPRPDVNFHASASGVCLAHTCEAIAFPTKIPTGRLKNRSLHRFDPYLPFNFFSFPTSYLFLSNGGTMPCFTPFILLLNLLLSNPASSLNLTFPFPIHDTSSLSHFQLHTQFLPSRNSRSSLQLSTNVPRATDLTPPNAGALSPPDITLSLASAPRASEYSRPSSVPDHFCIDGVRRLSDAQPNIRVPKAYYVHAESSVRLSEWA